MRRNDSNRSFQRAAAILDALARTQENEGVGVSLTRLAAEVGLAKSTVHRLLRGLTEVGLVGTDDSGRSLLGRSLVRLGDLARSSHRDLDAVSDSLRRLSALTGDTAFYTERCGTVSVCVLREDGNGPFRNNVLAVGDRHPLGVGAGSLAILAALPGGEAHRVHEANLRAFDEDTEAGRILRSDRFAHALGAARTGGWALNDGMVVDESWAVGAVIPVRDDLPVQGALSVASIKSRLQGSRRTRIVDALHREVEALAARAGPLHRADPCCTRKHSKEDH